jgi:hypothetical protein
MSVGEIRSDVKTLLRALPDMDKRLSKVDSRQLWLMGVGAVFAGLAAKAGLPDVDSPFTS